VYVLVASSLTGRTFSLEVEASDAIEEVKSKVWDAAGIPIEQQSLLVGGRLMEDGRTLSDYNIHGGQTIQLVASVAKQPTCL